MISKRKNSTTHPFLFILDLSAPCVNNNDGGNCFVVEGTVTAYTQEKMNDDTKDLILAAVRSAIENGNLERGDARVIDVSYRSLSVFPLPDSEDDGDNTDGNGDNGDGGDNGDTADNSPTNTLATNGGTGDRLQTWGIVAISVGGSILLCMVVFAICLRRPRRDEYDDEKSIDGNLDEGSSDGAGNTMAGETTTFIPPNDGNTNGNGGENGGRPVYHPPPSTLGAQSEDSSSHSPHSLLGGSSNSHNGDGQRRSSASRGSGSAGRGNSQSNFGAFDSDGRFLDDQDRFVDEQPLSKNNKSSLQWV